MPPRPQTKRNLYATLDGIQRKVDGYTGGGLKRIEPPKKIPQAGSTRPYVLHEPVREVEEITGWFVCERDDPFISQLYELFERQMENPASAGYFLLSSHEDDLTLLGSIIYTRAVLQSVKPPEGDRNAHDWVKIEFTCQPEEAILDVQSYARSLLER